MRAERQRFAKEPILSGRLSAKENRDLGFVKAMSALPPKADISGGNQHVRSIRTVGCSDKDRKPERE